MVRIDLSTSPKRHLCRTHTGGSSPAPPTPSSSAVSTAICFQHLHLTLDISLYCWSACESSAPACGLHDLALAGMVANGKSDINSNFSFHKFAIEEIGKYPPKKIQFLCVFLATSFILWKFAQFFLPNTRRLKRPEPTNQQPVNEPANQNNQQSNRINQ